jgi:alpha-L-fucosidase 2
VTLDLVWDNGKPTKATLTVDENAPSRSIVVTYAGKVVASFTTKGGLVEQITSF